MKYKKAVVAIAKDEAPYLAEWISHYLTAGFEGIYIYINNISDHSELILKKISHYYNSVKILYSDGYSDFKEFAHDDLIHPNFLAANPMQSRAYAEGYRLAGSDGYDYVAFFDLDEYLTPRNQSVNLDSLIAKYSEPDFIRFKWFNVAGSEKDFDNAVRPTFIGMCSKIGKSIVKTGIEVKLNSTHSVRTSDRSNRYQSGLGKIHEHSVEQALESIDSDFVLLHHLYRSESEYLARLLRGDFIFNTALGIKLNRGGWKPRGRDSITIDNEVVLKFIKEQDALIDNCDLNSYIEVAQHLSHLRASKISHIKDTVINDYNQIRKVLRGTKHEW